VPRRGVKATGSPKYLIFKAFMAKDGMREPGVPKGKLLAPHLV
jgi:hypothetical protein